MKKKQNTHYDINLDKGECICDTCFEDGNTETKKFLSTKKGELVIVEVNVIHVNPYCSKCHGAGKLNWIENVFGKEDIPATVDEYFDDVPF